MTPAPVGEQVPMTCRVADVLRVLNMSRSAFYEQMHKGTFPVPELLPRIGRGPRFKGEDVLAYRDNRQAR